jgi:hypothetical protein
MVQEPISEQVGPAEREPTTTVEYPGASAPGPVPVRVELPSDWLVSAAPGLAFVASSPIESGGVHPSAVLSVRRVDGALTLRELSDLVSDEILSMEGGSLTSEATLDLDGREAAVKEFVLQAADSPAVHQLQVMCLAPVGDRVADAVTLTVSCGAAGLTEHADVMRSIALSVRVG